MSERDIVILHAMKRSFGVSIGIAIVLLDLAPGCSGDDTSGSGGSGTTGTSAESTGSAGASSATGSGGASSGGGSGGAGGAEIPCSTPSTCDWVGIIGTGQSLSVGFKGSDLKDLSTPYNNLKLYDSSPAPNYDYVNDPNGLSPTLSAVPLVDWIKPGACNGPPPGCGYNTDPPITNGGYTNNVGDGYPNNIYGQTPNLPMADQITALALAAGRPDYVTVQSVIGSSGKPMAYIDKRSATGNSYAAGLYEAHAFKNLAQAAGKTLGYGAVILTHGETDAENGMPTAAYEIALAHLWSDYNADLVALTGQVQSIPLILSQQHAYPPRTSSPYTGPNTPGYPTTTQAQWRAGVDYPNQVVVAGPKYQYPYDADLLHMQGAGYRRLGEKYAEVYYEVVEKHAIWKPLQPTSVVRTSPTKITATFDVPFGPLNWDTSLAPPHQTANHPWANGRGFEVLDAAGAPVQVTSVSLDAANRSVDVLLGSAPAGLLTLQYAMSQDQTNGTSAGTPQGRRGQLRDSDPFIGRDQETITCTVTTGSAIITNCQSNLRPTRAVTDVVTEANASVVAIDLAGTQAALSSPWTLPSGTRPLTFHAEQRNYAVAFSMLAKDDSMLAKPQPHDFNGDGFPDLLWRNYATGENTLYTLNGADLLAAVVLRPVADLAWKVEGAANDFNGDGKTDVIWRNYTTGANQIWLMNGTELGSAVDVPPVGDLNWHIETSADLNHDGSPDIVWRNYSSGQVVVWAMNGTTCIGLSGNSCPATQVGFTVGDASFKIRGAGDMNEDGNLDLIWHNVSSGEIVVWYLNGLNYVNLVTIAFSESGLLLEQVADFNRDGWPDLAFRDTSGVTPIVWFMNGAPQKVSTANLPSANSVDWQIGTR